MKNDLDSIRQMALAMGKEWHPLLEKTLPKIVVHIFPHFAAGGWSLMNSCNEGDNKKAVWLMAQLSAG